jgi:RNA polymerase sigma-70 factor (ECF subfamily)
MEPRTVRSFDTDLRQEALAHLDGLFRYALVLSHDHGEAQDLVQETYLRAIGACDRLTDHSNLKGWLFTILRNAWLNHVRHSQCGPRMVFIDGAQEHAEAPNWDEDPYATYLNKMQCAAVRTAVDQLPQPYREAIVLREYEGLNYQELAQVLNIPAGTVMSRLARARRKLRVLLAPWNQALKA